jgi:cytoskeleton protein RodZ
MGSLGEMLRQARLDRGASLADVEQETHIRRKYLEALEAEDYAALPAQVYTRGFIRTYARFVGLDPESTLDLFSSGRAREERPALRSATPQLSSGRPVSIRILMGFVGAVLVGLLLTYLYTQYNSFIESLPDGQAPSASRAGTSVPTRSAAAGSPVALTPVPSPTQAPAPAAQPTPDRGIAVEARVNERTWMEVWVDGTSQLQSTLQTGAVQNFTATQSIKMRVGNAGGVEVTVNGEPKGALGDRHQVKEFVWERKAQLVRIGKPPIRADNARLYQESG